MGYLYNSTKNTFSFDSSLITPLPQVIWHITKKCKLNCKFCFDGKHDDSIKENIPINDIMLILKKLDVQKIDISGGEPLLSNLLQQIIDACLNMGIKITLTTSGVGKKANIDWLVNNWNRFSRIILSLDGPMEIHNFLRGSNIAYGAFENIYQSLKEKGCSNIRTYLQ